jgi:nitrate/nitrite transport system substrate-binding protein
VGVLAASGSQIWNNATEKVLGVLEDWHLKNPATHLRLRLALMEACEWLADMNNRELAIKVISKPEYLDISEHSLRPSLTGKIAYNRVNDSHDLPNFHVFSKYNAGFPWRSQAELMLKECENLLGKEIEQAKISSISQQCYRTDLYREAARHLNITSPDSDYKTETITDQFSDLNNGINESETPAIRH